MGIAEDGIVAVPVGVAVGMVAAHVGDGGEGGFGVVPEIAGEDG